MQRRDFLTGAVTASVLGTPVRSEGRGLSFGLTPVFLTNDQELLTLFRGYLDQALGAPVQLVQRRTYQEITAMLLAGQVDAAWICGYPYVRHHDDLALLAVPVWRGHPLYQSYLIGRPAGEEVSLADLRGEIHAFSDPDSNSGYLVTTAALAGMAERPESFFARSFFTYGHRNVVRAVASGLAQSGSVDGYVWEALTVAEPALPAATRVIARSDWLGFPPIACLRNRADSPHMRALAGALAQMDLSEDGRAVLTLLQLDGFQAASPELFDGIAALARTVGARR